MNSFLLLKESWAEWAENRGDEERNEEAVSLLIEQSAFEFDWFLLIDEVPYEFSIVGEELLLLGIEMNVTFTCVERDVAKAFDDLIRRRFDDCFDCRRTLCHFQKLDISFGDTWFSSTLSNSRGRSFLHPFIPFLVLKSFWHGRSIREILRRTIVILDRSNDRYTFR